MLLKTVNLIKSTKIAVRTRIQRIIAKYCQIAIVRHMILSTKGKTLRILVINKAFSLLNSSKITQIVQSRLISLWKLRPNKLEIEDTFLPFLSTPPKSTEINNNVHAKTHPF